MLLAQTRGRSDTLPPLTANSLTLSSRATALPRYNVTRLIRLRRPICRRTSQEEVPHMADKPSYFVTTPIYYVTREAGMYQSL